jgi:predicted nucleic acid-binding Zn ribbon protein
MAPSDDQEPGIREAWTDFENHRSQAKRYYHGRSPKKLGNVLAQLVNRRGYAQIRAAGEREEAWEAVAGEQLAKVSQMSSLRRGVFEVVIGNSLMMQELTFRKKELLRALQQILPDAGIKQLKFKVGKINSQESK